jgi:K+ transporter
MHKKTFFFDQKTPLIFLLLSFFPLLLLFKILTVIFLLTKPTETHVIGVLSLIIWTLIIIVTMEYAWLAMSLSKKGEGGTIVLKEILAL